MIWSLEDYTVNLVFRIHCMFQFRFLQSALLDSKNLWPPKPVSLEAGKGELQVVNDLNTHTHTHTQCTYTYGLQNFSCVIWWQPSICPTPYWWVLDQTIAEEFITSEAGFCFWSNLCGACAWASSHKCEKSVWWRVNDLVWGPAVQTPTHTLKVLNSLSLSLSLASKGSKDYILTYKLGYI